LLSPFFESVVSGRSVRKMGAVNARRFWIALVVGALLVGALVALQLVDDGNDDDASVRVKGVQASRAATLAGVVENADGWSVEITVLSPDGTRTAVAEPDGRYRVVGLTPGPVEVSWVGDAEQSSSQGITLGGQRTGRTQITLDAGRNNYDFSL
jgi:hypothetical protein